MDSRKKPVIFVVDNKRNTIYNKKILKSTSSEVGFASNINEVLLLLEKKTYDLLITD